MKKLLLLVISLALFTSCQLNEEITFHKNGSGEYKLAIDMSGFMAMAKGMDQKKDSLTEKKEPLVKDTVYKLADMLSDKKDSIAHLPKEERELLESMKNVVVKIHADEMKGEMTMAYIYPFKKTSDLENILEKFEKIEKNRKDKNDIMTDMSNGLPKTKVSYNFSKRKFHRKVKLIKTEKKKDSINKDSKEKEAMLGMFKYKLIYHFPYTIKSVSYKDALLSADRKTLIIEVPIDKMINNPTLLDFEVKFD